MAESYKTMETTKPPPILADCDVVSIAVGEAPELTAIVDRAKAGEEEAFAELMRRYERRILSLGMHMGLSRVDSQDACQESFIKVFRYIRRFQSGRSFYNWLHRIAIHVIYDHLTRRRTTMNISIEEIPPDQLNNMRTQGTSLERRLQESDLAAKLLKGLDRLSRRERVVFVLRDLQGVSTGEIGRILRLSQITVRRHCMGARRRLRDHLFDRNH
jgi:RNA polymerase sigma-70 factor (ECF subfamily)